ncbi:hypothetical protein LIER_28943 [Lithospermum erythrorhizon]|uniref:Uncharacterized protein n=1 Tax=Lithospermum erythrorhizon TaxID=34254 RepID=A0AAV3RMC9_LITER
MSKGVPRIWTLKEEARGIPIPSAEDMYSVGKLRGALPQGENKLPWYTFCDDDELVAIVASKEPQLVDFDDMLIDRPSLFTRVPIVTKNKTRESMIPEATSTSPPTNIVPTPPINPLLKRMVTAAPTVPPPLKKAKKNAPPKKKILAHDSSKLSIPFPTPFQKVALEEKVRLSKEKSVHPDEGEASAQVPQLPKCIGLYLAKPFEVPNLEVTSESPRGACKFHFHLAKPLLSKGVAAQYTPLVDPYATFTQAMKHINQAVNGAFVLVRRADHLALDNNSLRYKVEGMNKTISFKNNLNKELDKECKDQKAKLEKEAKDDSAPLTLPLPKGAVLLEEGGETPNLPVEEDHPANP